MKCILNKLFFAIALLLISKLSYSQIIVEPKVNVALAAVGIVNPAVEFSVSPRISVQLEFLGSYAKTDFLGTGSPFLATVGLAECRYYIKKNIKGFYVGGVVGTGNWKMSRSLLSGSQSSGNYDYGYSLMVGAALGYKFLISERWGIDINLGGGWVHSNHEGYNKHGVQQVRLNGSDEWLPFKGGIYFSYRLGGKNEKE